MKPVAADIPGFPFGSRLWADTKVSVITRCGLGWIIWMVLLWPGLLVAKEYTDTALMDDLLGEVSESARQQWLLSGYNSFDGEKPAAVKTGVAVHKDITFIQAVALYVARDYENAHKAFKFLFLKDMSSAKINFYLGLCAYELGDYDGAIAAYERVLFVQPNNARCRFELGRSYYALGMYEQAEIEFRKVLRLTDDAKLIGSVKKYIANIDAFRKRHFLSGNLSFGAVVDTNINNGNNYTIPVLGNAPVNKPTSDYAHAENAALRYLYDAGDKNEFFWQNEVVLYNKSYEREKDYDIFFGRLQTGVEYKSSRFYLIVPAGYEYLRYGGEAYLYATDLSLKLYYPLKNSSTFYFYAKRKEEINLIKINRGFDTDSNEVTFGLQNALGKLLSGVSIYLTQKERRKKRGVETSVDSDDRRIKLNYQKKINEQISFYPQYTYRELRFLQKQDFWFEPEAVERFDISQNVSLTLLFSRSEDRSLTLSYSYSDVRSGYPLYSYNKSIISLMYNITLE